MFDIDGTLITTRTGSPNYLPKSVDDWIYLGNIPEILSSLPGCIILVSNQSKNTDYIVQRYLDMIEDLECSVPVKAFLLYKDMRKPSIKIMDHLPEPKKIVFSGDAIKDISDYPPYQFSNDDYDFFLNLKTTFRVKFKTPIEFFGHCIPRKISKSTTKTVVLLIGNPGSGKTTFASSLVSQGFQLVNNDTKTNHNKHLQLFTGPSIVVDNTNGKQSIRQYWKDLAEKFDYTFKIVWFIRDGRPWNQLREKPISEIAYRVYSKNFEVPELPVYVVY